MIRPFFLASLLLLLVLILAACGEETTPTGTPGRTTAPGVTPLATPPTSPRATTPAPATGTPQATKTLNVTVGSGQDTTAVNAFLPANVRVRVGDTVTWKIKPDEIHTVSFMDEVLFPPFAVPTPGGGPTDLMFNPKIAFPTRPPGAPVEAHGGTGYFNSGILSKEPPGPGAPPNDTFSLTFNRPGTYPYFCLIHLASMQGTVTVEPATVTDLPSQADIDRQAKAEEDALLKLVDTARQQAKEAIKEPGPAGTTTWTIHAGAFDIITGDERPQALDFLPKDLTVKVGDTVIWSSPHFHTVTFNPTPPPPEFVIPRPQPQGPPILSLNPQVVAPVKPALTFDPTKYYNSGIIGPFTPVSFFSLTFDRPGKFDYFCAIHRAQGMEGTITVEAR